MKTVAKWRKPSSVGDEITGPKEPRSTVLAEGEKAIVVVPRRHTLLPPDDSLYALQPSIPHLSGSALHRCVLRFGISRPENVSGDKPKTAEVQALPRRIMSLRGPRSHNVRAEVPTAEG